MGRATRQHGLDAVRGIAAAAVVVHHLLLSGFSIERLTGVSAHGAWRVLASSPFHVIWDGPGAVVVFFVLSGYVLALPTSRWQVAQWLAYYPRRAVRLYVPAVAALFVALALWAFADRTFIGQSAWLADHHPGAGGSFGRSAALVFGATYLDSPLWSLQWEVLFSALLPIFLLGIRLNPVFVGVVLGALVGAHDLLGLSAWWLYLPMFGMGVVLASERERLGRLAERAGRVGWLVLVAGVVALEAQYYAVHVPAVRGVDLLGATLLIAWVAFAPAARGLGRGPFLAWLGSRSFSLYLVHEPIVVATADLLHASSPVVVAIFGLPVIAMATEGFFRLVERPSIRASRAIGRRLVGAFESHHVLEGSRPVDIRRIDI